MIGESPKASARPTHWLSIPALPSVTTQQRGRWAAPSEAKHMIQAEGALTDQSVIAEQAAGRIADDDVAILAGTRTFVFGESFFEAPKVRTAAGDADVALGNLLAVTRQQNQRRVGLGVPGQGSGIDKV